VKKVKIDAISRKSLDSMYGVLEEVKHFVQVCIYMAMDIQPKDCHHILLTCKVDRKLLRKFQLLEKKDISAFPFSQLTNKTKKNTMRSEYVRPKDQPSDFFFIFTFAQPSYIFKKEKMIK
jgi:hypothetical protein